MTAAIEHPAPPVVTQQPRDCWLAAYDSWNRACVDHLGQPSGPLPERMREYLRRGRLLTAAGRLSPDGVVLLGGAAVMRFQGFDGHEATADVIRSQLRLGYVYCGMNLRTPGGMIGHAFVVYALDGDRVRVMDPTPNQGLVTLSVSFFAKRAIRVAFGVPLATALDDAIRSATANLR